MNELLSTKYASNTVQDYLVAIGIVVFGLLFLALFKRFLLHQLK